MILFIINTQQCSPWLENWSPKKTECHVIHVHVYQLNRGESIQIICLVSYLFTLGKSGDTLRNLLVMQDYYTKVGHYFNLGQILYLSFWGKCLPNFVKYLTTNIFQLNLQLQSQKLKSAFSHRLLFHTVYCTHSWFIIT